MALIKKISLMLLFLIFISLIFVGSLLSSGCSKRESGWQIGKLFGDKNEMMPEMNEEIKQKMINACDSKNEGDKCIVEFVGGLERRSFEGEGLERSNDKRDGAEKSSTCKLNEDKVLICRPEIPERNFMNK